MLMSSKSFCKCWSLAETWKNYKAAMSARRPGSELNHNGFGYYVRRRCVVYSSLKGSAIIGQINEEGMLLVSHHAPSSRKDGVELLRKLNLDRSVKAVLAVTEDLVSMLEKLGFINQHQTMVSDFRGHNVEKHLFTNF
jgi:hypothetical protein